jgi:hypothetical protein
MASLIRDDDDSHVIMYGMDIPRLDGTSSIWEINHPWTRNAESRKHVKVHLGRPLVSFGEYQRTKDLVY